MKKLSEYKDREAIEILAKILAPVVTVFGDKAIAQELVRGNKLKSIQMSMEKYPDEIFKLLATLEGVPVEQYHCSVTSIPKMLLEMMEDEDLTSFFTEQATSNSD